MNYLPRKHTSINGHDMMLVPFDEEYAHRTLSIVGEITAEVATSVNAALRCLSRESDEDIVLYIQSAGGEVRSGLSIVDTIHSIKCDVVTVAAGSACSMAALIVAAGTKSKRWCLPNSEIMIHQPLGGVHGQATDIQVAAANILMTKERLNKLLAQFTEQPYEKVCADTERDRWLDAEQAAAYGIVDRIGDPFSEY